MVTRRSVWCLLALAGLLVGCAGKPAVDSAPHEPGLQALPEAAAVPCGPADQAARSADLVLRLPGTIRPGNAPLPGSEAERHVFAALYEPLVRVDCEGQAEPALARRWVAYDQGRRWVLHLREDARFWNGDPAGAAAVVASWRRTVALCRLRGEPSPFLSFDPRGASLTVLGPHTLQVELNRPLDQFPLQLAHPALAVVGSSDGRGWLAGSGPCRPEGNTLVPHSSHPLAPRWQRLELILDDDGGDPRDALATGAHAMVTRSRSVAGFHAGQPGLQQHDLPWDRWYYLLVPASREPAQRRRWADGWDRRELAFEVGDELTGPAPFAAYEPPPSAEAVLDPFVPTLVAPANRPPLDRDLVLWPDDDTEAGQLAERLAAQASRPLRDDQPSVGRGPLTPPPVGREAALSVPAADLTSHAQQGQVGAVVLPWPRRFPRAEDELSRMLSLASWLQDAARDEDVDPFNAPPGARPAQFVDAARGADAVKAMRRLERGGVVQPLVRSHAMVVSRPEVRGWSWLIDGTLRLWTLTRQD